MRNAILTVRSNQQNCSIKKGVLENFTIFTGKHLRQSLFLSKVAGFKPLDDCFWTVLNVVNIITRILKETRNSFKKWPSNLWWILNKTIMKVGNIIKAATFKNFFHLSIFSHRITFLRQCFLIFSWDRH